VCCDSCPAAFHADCLELPGPPEGTWYCKNCTSGMRPHYGDIVWVKLGCYRSLTVHSVIAMLVMRATVFQWLVDLTDAHFCLISTEVFSLLPSHVGGRPFPPFFPLVHSTSSSFALFFTFPFSHRLSLLA